MTRLWKPGRRFTCIGKMIYDSLWFGLIAAMILAFRKSNRIRFPYKLDFRSLVRRPQRNKWWTGAIRRNFSRKNVKKRSHRRRKFWKWILLFDASQCIFGTILGGEGWWSGSLAGAMIQGTMKRGADGGAGTRGIHRGRFARFRKGFFTLGAIETVIHLIAHHPQYTGDLNDQDFMAASGEDEALDSDLFEYEDTLDDEELFQPPEVRLIPSNDEMIYDGLDPQNVSEYITLHQELEHQKPGYFTQLYDSLKDLDNIPSAAPAMIINPKQADAAINYGRMLNATIETQQDSVSDSDTFVEKQIPGLNQGLNQALSQGPSRGVIQNPPTSTPRGTRKPHHVRFSEQIRRRERMHKLRQERLMLKELLLDGDDDIDHPDWREYVESSIESGEPVEEMFRTLDLNQQLYPNISLDPPQDLMEDMEDQAVFFDDEDD